MCVPRSISVHHICEVPSEVRGGARAPGARATEGCELPFGCWEQNPGPLQEQKVDLRTEPSLKPEHGLLFCLFCSLSLSGSHYVALASLEPTM